ncbi:hypothetical protein QJQ45_003830 [Haematococcus lacustris]|nr:hypothetical protein QJQ45_003830 [Haematococcus lacustris]
MCSQVLGSYIVPRLVQEKLQHGIATSRHATAAGIDGRWCWVYCHDTVLLWQYQQGADARMRTLRLPPNVTRSSLLGIFVSVLVSASDSCLTVLVCTGSGQLVAWLDANNLADPFVHQLTSHLGSPAHGSSPAITSFSAAAPAQASSPGFTAAVCSADGCVFIVEGSPLGLHEQRLSAPPARPTQSSVLGSLGHVMAWTYSEAFAPGQKFLKTKSSGRPARAVNLVSRDMSHLHLLVMTDETLECWLVGGWGGCRRAGQKAGEQASRQAGRQARGRQLESCVRRVKSYSVQRLALLGWASASSTLSPAAGPALQLTQGLRPRQQLLWSWQSLLAARSEVGGAAAANCALAVAGQQAALLVQGPAGPAGQGQQAALVHRLQLNIESGPVHDHCLQLQGVVSEGPWAHWRLVVGQSPSPPTLLLSPSFKLYQLSRPPTSPAPSPCIITLLSDDPDNLAAAAAPPPTAPTTGQGQGLGQGPSAAALPPTWLLLSATFGLLQLASAADTSAAQSAAAPPHSSLPHPTSPTSTRSQDPASLPLPLPRPFPSSPLVRGAAVGGPPAAPGLPLSVEGRQQVGQLLDSVLGQAAAALAAQPAGASPAAAVLGIAAGLRRRLDSLGALSPSSNAGVVADFSTGLLDRLPKHPAHGSCLRLQVSRACRAGGGGSAGQLASLLSEKEQRHSLLLLILAEAGVLHSLPPAVLRSLLENAEKLAVVSSLLGQHGAAVREQQASASAPQGQEPLIGQVVCAAGRSVSCQAAGHQSLAPAEVFYAQPSLSGPQLLLALARAAGQVAEQAGSGFTAAAAYGAGELREQAVDLGRLVGCIMAAALRQRSALHASHGLSASQVYSQLGQPSWLAGQEARACFHAVAKACQAVRQLLLGPSFAGIPRGSSLSPALLQLARTHFAVADVLLNAYSAAVAAAGEGDSKQCLLSEYRAVRGGCLATLLLDALAELDGAQEPQAEQDLLIWQVEQLAAGHHCYPQLYEVCGALGARLGPGGRTASASSNPRLHQHMASVGAEDGAAEQDTFARFVYQRLLEDKQPAELLQLPAFFTADLTAFLRLLPGQASLLWPLLLRTGQWGEAAEAAEQQADATQSSNLKQARLLAIAKLARLASQELPGSQVEQLSTRLQLLRLQTSLSQLRQHTAPAGGAGAGGGGGAAAWAAAGLERGVMGGPGPKGGVREEAVLDLAGLVEAALGEEGRGAGGAGALLALEALALQPPQVMKAHRRYVQESWRLVLGASDWAGLAAELATADPDACEAAMQRTPLHQARTRQARGGGGGGGCVDGTGHSVCVGGQGVPAVLLCSGHGAFGHSASVEDSGPLQEVVAWLRQWTRADPSAQARAMQQREQQATDTQRLQHLQQQLQDLQQDELQRKEQQVAEQQQQLQLQQADMHLREQQVAQQQQQLQQQQADMQQREQQVAQQQHQLQQQQADLQQMEQQVAQQHYQVQLSCTALRKNR